MEFRDQDFISFLNWLLPTSQSVGWFVLFVFVTFTSMVVGTFIAFLVQTLSLGPGEAFFAVARSIADGVVDLTEGSFRRLYAIAALAFRETMRNKVLVVFGIFVVIMLFAGWFLDTDSENPAEIYIVFVLTTTNFLILLLAVLISSFSIPNDIKSRTIYTVVTKPVRAGEIVVGKIIGFAAVGTMLLVMLAVISFFFVTRGLDHSHVVEEGSVREVSNQKGEPIGWSGQTTLNQRHRHTFFIDNQDGRGRTDDQKGHWHEVVRDESGKITVGPPQEMLMARVPVFGKLGYVDRTGKDLGRLGGISVGYEWSYRKYIEGGTLASAVWQFTDVTSSRFSEGLPVELNLRVFRTSKGDIEAGILGTITLKNPDSSAKIQSSTPISFTVKEFTQDLKIIPRKLQAVDNTGALQDIDLFEDLVSEDGRLEVWIQCSQRGQYFGMATADCYLRANNGYFFTNFLKGYIAIWLQMLVVIAFGVMFSTFLNGPVAMFTTLIVIILGFYAEFVVGVARGDVIGGGPIEAFVRIVRQHNLSTDLDSFQTVIRRVDWFFMQGLRVFVSILPNYESFRLSSWVANGYDIFNELIWRHVLMTFAYVTGISVLGYFILKSREIAS